jgi:hypothetical protein
MAKRRRPPLPPHFDPRHAEPSAPHQQHHLDPYEEEEAVTLPWLPLVEREPGARH